MKYKLAKFMAIAAILATFIGGCQSIERTARDVIAQSKGTLDALKVEYKCATTGSDVCSLVARAVAAKDIAIDALEVYCAGPQFQSGGTCQPPKKGDAQQQAAAKLQASVQQLSQIVKDVSTLAQTRRVP